MYAIYFPDVRWRMISAGFFRLLEFRFRRFRFRFLDRPHYNLRIEIFKSRVKCKEIYLNKGLVRDWQLFSVFQQENVGWNNLSVIRKQVAVRGTKGPKTNDWKLATYRLLTANHVLQRSQICRRQQEWTLFRLEWASNLSQQPQFPRIRPKRMGR